MESRPKSEQFRKSRNNYFKRGYQIGKKSEAKIFVLMERNDKFYKFMNTDRPFWSSKADIVSPTALKPYAPLLTVLRTAS
jgi:hypothetical protein